MSAARGTVTNINPTDGSIQAEILSDEILSEMDLATPFGFAYKPDTGSGAIFIFLNNDRDQGVCLSIPDRDSSRFTLNAGEVVIYNDDENYIKFNEDGEIEIKSSKIKIDGDVELTGFLKLKNESVNLNTHTHTSNAPSLETSPPTPTGF